jgi:hypothetical protein
MRSHCCAIVLTGMLWLATGEFSGKVHACDCHQARAFAMGMPSYGGFSMAYPMMSPYSMSPPAFQQPGYPELVSPPAPMLPGTVGQTYSRPSHPVPVEEHPRTAMMAVRDDGTVPHLTAQNMGGIKMKSGIWLFESNRPLDPGACHIIRVEARKTPEDVEPYQTKFVRLIPGRIVYLDF